MSYTPLTDLDNELKDLNVEQDGQTIIQDRVVQLLEKLIKEQKLTNKLLNKIYKPY